MYFDPDFTDILFGRDLISLLNININNDVKELEIERSHISNDTVTDTAYFINNQIYDTDYMLIHHVIPG